MDSQSSTSFKVLMFPWLAHGHIFPFLELSKRLLARKDFHIYLCSTAINFSSITDFIKTHNLDASIDLVELHLEPSPQLPPHYHTTKNLPSHLILTLLKAFQTAKSSFSYIIATLKPDLVLYDIFQPWAARLASSQAIPAVYFPPFGAATISCTYHQYVCWDDNFPFPELLCLKGYERKSSDQLVQFILDHVFEQDQSIYYVNFKLSSEVALMKTSSGLEGKYMDYASSVCRKKLLPVGPLVTCSPSTSSVENSEILQWLSKKGHHSTVYISFGSEYFLSMEEIQEIAKGLEICEVNFIWVIRFPLGEKTITIEEVHLPKGFLERVKGRGIIVTGWAPQAEILGHPNTGAFISHCGWSSVMESMYIGVPIIGMPLKFNMFIDANMLAEAGACKRVPIKEENEWYKGEDIAEVISDVIMGKHGDMLRSRARELSEKMRSEEKEAIDVVSEKLWKICLENQIKE